MAIARGLGEKLTKAAGKGKADKQASLSQPDKKRAAVLAWQLFFIVFFLHLTAVEKRMSAAAVQRRPEPPLANLPAILQADF